MKKRILVLVSALLVFGLAIAVYALNTTGTPNTVAKTACCCGNGESCPMKDKNAASTDKAGAHENCDCRKDGADSCPMKKGEAAATTDGKTEGSDACPMMKKGDGAMARHEMKMGDGEACPMMKKGDGTATMAKHEMKMGNGENCQCRKHAKEKKDAPAL
jgi:hypothetical protein